jgi:hypothetical protein
MPGKYNHTNRPPYAILYADIYNADHQNHIDHLEPRYIDRDGTSLADMQAVSDPGNDGSEVQPTTLRDEIRQLRNEIKVLKSYIAQTAPTNWYSKLASTNRAHLLRDGTLPMTGPLTAKSGAGGVNNPNNAGLVFDNDNDSGLFSSAAGIIDLFGNGVSFLQANSAVNLLKLFKPLQFPATQVSSTDPNALDDYEEGTWTPTLQRISTNPTLTYTTQIGKYTKIGNFVYISGRIVVNTVSSQGSGSLMIGYAPFGFIDSFAPTPVLFNNWPSYTSTSAPAVAFISFSTQLMLVQLQSNYPQISVNIDNGMEIRFGHCYFTNT